MVEIYLYYSIGILILEHSVHDLMLCCYIYMVGYCETKRGRIEVIPIQKIKIKIKIEARFEV